MIDYLTPKKIISFKKGENCEVFLQKQDRQIGLCEKSYATFSNGGYIILDFGQEICGGIRILTYFAKNDTVRIRFGESLTECCSELGGENNATNDHSLRDFSIQLQRYSDMTFGNTGFRFLRLDFFGEVKIKSMLAQSQILKKRVLYSYKGKDEKIREVYKIAKRTIDLCASGEYLWDGIKRDRLVWIGDMHPEMLALTTLYGRLNIVEKSLNFVKEQTPLPNWMNRIPTYSMWWIIIVCDYFECVKCEDFAKEQIEYMERLLDFMRGFVLEGGELNYPSYFVDWATSGSIDEQQGVRAINIMAIKKAITFLKHFDRETKIAQELLARLLKKEITVLNSKQCLALKYFAVGLSQEEQKKLTDGGAKGLSTFMSYYILKAIASFDKENSIKIMKDYYGTMIEKGATTFWEDFDMKWAKNSCRIDEFPKDGEKDIHGDFGAHCYTGLRHSLCHGWSAGVIRFIQEECE